VSSIIVGPALIRRIAVHVRKKRINKRVGHVENSKKIVLNKFLQSLHLDTAIANKIITTAA
jgi:hypothetical protein